MSFLQDRWLGGLVALIALMLFIIPNMLHAACGNGDGNDNNITCDTTAPNPETNTVTTGAGNDTVNIPTGTSINTASNDGIFASGNLTVNNDGGITGNSIGIRVAGGGNVSHSGTGDVTGNNFGIRSGGNVSHSGTGTVSGNMGIFGNNAPQSIEIQNGTIEGTGGTAINASNGNDTVTINTQATITGLIDGGGHTVGDTLIFTGDASQTESDALNAVVVNTCAPCNVTLNGKPYSFQNFEALLNQLTIIAQQTGQPIAVAAAAASEPSAPQTSEIQCANTKVFRTPDGFIQVYSGFNELPPNGFLVAVFSAADAIAGTHFTLDDPNTPSWAIVVAQNNTLNVVDASGAVVGICQY